MAAIRDAVQRLADFPESGRVVPELGTVRYREVIFEPYRIVYEIRQGNVYIVGVVHSTMDLRARAEERGWQLN